MQNNRLQRFLDAQKNVYPIALAEICAGRKRSHWMWYIFPQLRELAKSSTADYYGIEDLAEAKEYLSHPILGERLREISGELLKLPETSAEDIFGRTDTKKLRSCMTLFLLADETADVFRQVLDRYYNGEQDLRTIQLLSQHQN